MCDGFGGDAHEGLAVMPGPAGAVGGLGDPHAVGVGVVPKTVSETMSSLESRTLTGLV
jgi:hypothetical protein